MFFQTHSADQGGNSLFVDSGQEPLLQPVTNANINVYVFIKAAEVSRDKRMEILLQKWLENHHHKEQPCLQETATRENEVALNHRISDWFGLEEPLKLIQFQSPAMGREIFHSPMCCKGCEMWFRWGEILPSWILPLLCGSHSGKVWSWIEPILSIYLRGAFLKVEILLSY